MKGIKKEKGIIKEKKFKIKNLFKNSIFTFILGIFLTSIIGVSAASVLYSKDVTYDNSSSGLSSTNLQDALDELYEQAKNAPSCDSDGNCTVECPSGQQLILKSNTTYKCGIPPVEMGGKKVDVVTSGDGLYADSVTSGRYIYRGTTVNNYITFNNETWRIISVENDGTIKIIRNEQLSSTLEWDAAGTRNKSTSTYCKNASSFGCNAWAATANLVNTPSTFVQYSPNGNTSDSTNYSGTVTGDASLNTYLNGTYYNSLSDKDKVVTGTFNVSTPGNNSDTETLEMDAEQEKQYKWQGKVALMNVTELLRASTSSGCTSLSAGYNSASTSTCSSNNWLWPTFNTYNWEWTVSPNVTSIRNSVWRVDSSGCVYNNNAHIAGGVRPVLHLSSSITLSGSGTSDDSYKIVG